MERCYVNKHEQRKLILGYYGLTDPKELPEECKKCSNFYCTFCCRCRHLTKKSTDWDCSVPNDNETENYKNYEKFCNAVVREYAEANHEKED